MKSSKFASAFDAFTQETSLRLYRLFPSSCAALVVAAICCSVAVADENPAAAGFDRDGSDALAIELADQVMLRLGGRENWDSTRYLTWRFFGKRRHVWDKWSGRIRFEQGDPDRAHERGRQKR